MVPVKITQVMLWDLQVAFLTALQDLTLLKFHGDAQDPDLSDLKHLTVSSYLSYPADIGILRPSLLPSLIAIHLLALMH